MKIAYFDCPSGISGNMILGALIHAGLDQIYLKKQLSSLRLSAYSLQLSKIKKHSMVGTYVNVKVNKEVTPRSLKDILSIINKSKLSKRVKQLGSKIFKRLAAVEAKVHGVSVNQVHFHEVGAVDAIIDIVGTCIGLEYLGIEEIYCSPLPFGKGWIKHAHGTLPNPAPATVQLLKGIPTYGTDIKAELVTPTGAAIISTLAKSFSTPPRMTVSNIGYGAGSFNLPIPNLLRIFIGEAQISTEKDAILQIETNIDDMAPKAFPKIIAKIIKAGALDAYVAPILMKKERQGTSLIVLCEPTLKDKILELIFNLTTTFGVRVYLVNREKLQRNFIIAKTKYGKARVKVGLLGKKAVTVAPEFEDYKRIAKKHHIPIQIVYRDIFSSLRMKNKYV